jgi:uncharacterized protein involved in type VI secretion and phage assembly
VNDEVVVAFEGGDPNQPYVLGALWSDIDKPPKGTAEIMANGQVNQRLWRSRTGHLFIFDDTDGKESIQIIDKTEKNKIVITSSDNKLDVQLEGDIAVTSKTGQISLKAEKDIVIESSSGDVKMKGINTAFEASQSAKMKSGTTFELNSTAGMTLKASSTVEINGSVSAKLAGGMVTVEGQSMTEVKGALVKIN